MYNRQHVYDEDSYANNHKYFYEQFLSICWLLV
nr:MAG TPA: hypothetical protein [Crassvirales sp.]